MSAAPHVTVVIPTLDRDRYLCALLRQLAASTYPNFDVIIIDQTREHDSETTALLASAGGRAQTIPQEPGWFIGALLAGMRAARGDIVLFLDDDVVIADDLLQRHAANYQDPSVGGVGGLVLPPGGRPSFRLRFLFRRRPGLRPYFFSHAYGRRIEVACAPGGNMSFRRAAIATERALDPLIRTHHSEIDICQGVCAQGWKVVHDPGAKVTHLAAPGGTRRARGVQQDIFTDLHYVHRKYNGGLDLALLHAHTFWHFVLRVGLFADPRLGPLHLARYVRGFRLASDRRRAAARRKGVSA